MLSPSQRGLLEAIAHSDDPSVSPRDRLDAVKVLAEFPTAGEAAAVALALSIINLTDYELVSEVAGFFGATGADDELRRIPR